MSVIVSDDVIRRTKLLWRRKAKVSSIFGCQADVSLISDSKMEIGWRSW